MKCYQATLFGILLSPFVLVLFTIYSDLSSSWQNVTCSIGCNASGNRSLYYVSFGKEFGRTQGIGNQLFGFAAALYAAELTGRQAAIFDGNFVTAIDRLFDVGVTKYDEQFLCPCRLHDESKVSDAHFDQVVAEANDTNHRTIMLLGFYQNWKHVNSIDRLLRRHLVFRREIVETVDRFLVENVPKNGFLRVGIHVRRGDVANRRAHEYGFTAPNVTYFERAMTYFVDRHAASRIQFVVISNDMTWCRMNFHGVMRALNGSRGAMDHGITYADSHQSVGEHLALLASCDHVIMSTGTFGWWAAWLANGTTVYYADWPRQGSLLSNKINKNDFFPPWWIGMT